MDETEASNMVQEDNTNSENSPDYLYTALDQNEPQTRLLVLDPGDEDQELVGTLEACRLCSHMPKFEAISYCWGDTNARDFTICLDGKYLAITQNASLALRARRRQDKKTAVWMDQVCINQEDLDEKFHHIARMGQIYFNAETVAVYLGESFEGSNILFDFLDAIEQDTIDVSGSFRSSIPIPHDHPAKSIFHPDDMISPETLTTLNRFQNSVKTIIDAHETLLTAPWFRRIWIVQESGLSKRLLFTCGKRTAHWESVQVLNRGFPYRLHGRTVGLDVAQGLKAAQSISTLRYEIHGHNDHIAGKQLENRIGNRNYPQILYLLRQFRHHEATDIRDKIFGLLGLIKPDIASSFLDEEDSDDEGEEGGTSLHGNIIFVCLHFGLWHISLTGTLDVLMGTCSSATVHDPLPYWVPDWSMDSPHCDTWYAMPSYREPPHQAGMHRPAEIDFIPQYQTLIVKGVQVDEVESVVDISHDLHTFQNPSSDTWTTWKDFALMAVPQDVYGSTEGRYEAYWRTLVYDVDAAGDRATSELGANFKAWSEGQVDEANADVTGRLVWVGRRIFRTKRGYLGNACETVESGDKVCVFYGSRFPTILRERKHEDAKVSGETAGMSGGGPEFKTFNSHLHIGGDCYVHGLCDGEAFQIAENEGIEIQEFCIA